MSDEGNIQGSDNKDELAVGNRQQATSNQQQATENMETHAHHLHKAPGKNFWHYFFEFFMLFLAVFCGFLAENYREALVEHQREKQYIKSFIEDLKSDTATITANLNAKVQKEALKDSLIWYLNSPNPNQYGQRVYFLGRQLTRTSNFFPADRTIQQLKNSGGMRLIKNQQASDKILFYDKEMDKLMLSQNRQEGELNDIRPMMGRLMNVNVLQTMINGENISPPAGNPPLRTVDREFLLDFMYAVHQLKGSDEVTSSRLKILKESAISTMQFLEKTYHLE